MELKIKFFDELTTRELYEIARARTEIFLMEQRIVCQDLDRVDYDSLHCFLEEDGKLLACDTPDAIKQSVSADSMEAAFIRIVKGVSA